MSKRSNEGGREEMGGEAASSANEELNAEGENQGEKNLDREESSKENIEGDNQQSSSQQSPGEEGTNRDDDNVEKSSEQDEPQTSNEETNAEQDKPDKESSVSELDDHENKSSQDLRNTQSSDDTTHRDSGDDFNGRKSSRMKTNASKGSVVDKKRKVSQHAHMQAEVNKQKLLQAKLDREDRRNQIDERYQHLIFFVGKHIDMKGKDVEEFIIDATEYMNMIEDFFKIGGIKCIFFIYQDAEPPGIDSGRPLNAPTSKDKKMKRIMISTGNDVPVEGMCMYFMRHTNNVKITTKNLSKRVCFGSFENPNPELPGQMLTSCAGMLKNIFIRSLEADKSWTTIASAKTAAEVRKRFLVSVKHYQEFLLDSYHDIYSRIDLTEMSNINELMELNLKTSDEVLEAAKNPELVTKIEHIVILWCKIIEKILALSKQMRKETDDMGPLAELTYWRNLMSKMCYIIQQVQEWRFVNLLQVLVHARSKVLRRWKDVDSRVTDEFHEAKDNVRYMYALEKFCQPLYHFDPPGMTPTIDSMMYTIRAIHTTSRYYNTCEKVTALMVKMSNQMVQACKRYLTNDGTENIWTQPRPAMLDKFYKCIELYETYRGSYELTKQELEAIPDGKSFNFSVNHIFGRFEKFCERLKKIIEILEICNLYQTVHDSNIDGLEIISNKLLNLQKNLLRKTYDPLDFRKQDFTNDYSSIRNFIDDIQISLEKFMDKSIDNCPTAMHAIRLLDRFKSLRNRCLDIEEKLWYVYSFYQNEIVMLKSIYEAEKNDTPIPRGFPPFAGKLIWARHLYQRLERPMKWFDEYSSILGTEESRPTIKLFNHVAKKLVFYEMLFHDAWVKQSSQVYDALQAPVLTLRGNLRQELVLNFDPFFRQIIEETEVIRKLNLAIPEIAEVVYFKQDKLFQRYETMKSLLERFLRSKTKMPQDVSALMRPMMKKVERAFMPGSSSVNWASTQLEDYFDYIKTHLNEFEEVLANVNTLIKSRINQYLYDISHTMMIDFPEESALETDEFIHQIKIYGSLVAKELEYKSRLTEKAVVELINMLLNTAEFHFEEDVVLNWLDPVPNPQIVPKDSKGPFFGAESGAYVISTKDELAHVQDECRVAFAFYQNKFLEALQKTTRISLDTLRRRTEEPQVSKRNPEKVQQHYPLFYADFILTIPTIILKPSLDEIQAVLNRGVQMITETLKRVVVWGQDRRMSFDERINTPYYTEAGAAINDAGDGEENVYRRLNDIGQTVMQVDSLNPRLKNCLKNVMEYKDISKMVIMMQTSVHQARSRVQGLITQYLGYNYLWKDTRIEELAALVATEPALTELQAVMRSYEELEEDINQISKTHKVGPLDIRTNNLKLGLTVEVNEWKHGLCRLMNEKFRAKCIEISKFFDECNKYLQNPIQVIPELVKILKDLQYMRDRSVDFERMIHPIEECYQFLVERNYKVSNEEVARAKSVRHRYDEMIEKCLKTQERLTNAQELQRISLFDAIAKFKNDLKTFIRRYEEEGPMVEGLLPQEASDRLNYFEALYEELKERYETCNMGELLFGFEPNEYPQLWRFDNEFSLLQKLYGLYNDVNVSLAGYYVIKWSEVDVPKINNELQDFQSRCRKLPKALKDWPAYMELKKKIDEFNETVPLLELMATKSMEARHWEKIGEIVGYKFAFDDPNFNLSDVVAAPLLKFKDDVEDISIGAVKEKEIESKLRQILSEWSEMTLSFTTFKNRGEMLLKGQETSDMMTMLEDTLMILNTLLNNRYSARYRKEIQSTLTDFSNTSQILDMWLTVQNLWIYLEAVFVGGDIARQMPQEAMRFLKIDGTWFKIMTRAKQNPLVVPCCVSDDTMAKTLPHLLEQLELCQKSLSGYLESKRKVFPRFFFVSDPVLLEILGQASDSHTIQQHLLSVFENVNEIEFNVKEYDAMIGVLSKEGEKIPLVETVMAEGNVEVWLQSLLMEQKRSLMTITQDAVFALNDTEFDLVDFVASYIAQIGLLGIQILWTRDSENALGNARRDKKIMKQTNDRFILLLNTLISQTAKNLTKYERLKYESLITIHVHQKDIFEDLMKANLKNPNDFEWLKQSRFYFEAELEQCLIKITNINFIYQNEFLGATDRLVITPLTDRCYITIAQAVGNNLGANPAGPAGTGKTETTKDMAKALAKYCVVFNCSDQMDFRGLGRIFKGLAQSGSWGCFDEFNRIDLPVLSVAAQQMQIILQARKENKETFVFSDGDVVEMNIELGIIITMNPGYAGRQELPENLKVLFRAVAMVVPDKQIIMRVKLASCGYLENVILARKFFILYRLCEEQLSKQVHYDFGLRNILSVLRTLGFQKRSRPNDAEETVVMSVLRDMNLSKLVDEDEGLFLSLIRDLFPGVSLESAIHTELLRAVAEEVRRIKLINFPNWNLKLVQFYESSLVRHGIMALGPTGVGKTQMMNVLQKSLTSIGLPHKEIRMNPKAITSSQMFGKLDVTTNDWTDGIFSTIWRKSLKIKKTEFLWIILDGPVDAIWIENLNSVLDDSKILTLANGDRITMASTCKLVFEPDNVDNASPATISRVGMVNMNSSVLPWPPILQSWLLKRQKTESDILWPLFEKIFTDLMTFIRTSSNPKMTIPEALYIRQACDLLSGLLSSRDSSKILSNEYLENLFMFAIIWSVGSLLELEDRDKLQAFLIQHESGLKWPPAAFGETFFDYTVGPSGNWEHWNTFVEEFVYPPTSVPDFASILVPNVDNVRTHYLISLIAKQEKSVLLIGEQGTAKTVMIKNFLGEYNPDLQIYKTVNFSSATTPNIVQRTIESYLDKRMGTTYGPPRGRKMTIFIDDINMPEINEWGDQITNEIVRQLLEMKGFYSLDKPGEFMNVLDIQIIGAMIHPGGGRNDVPTRLKRQFCIFNCTLPSISSMNKIFDVIASGYFNPHRFGEEIVELIPKLVPLTRNLWQSTKYKMLPTPAKFHYVFNLRDLSRIWEGILKVRAKECNNARTIMALWKHECTRVISDRFVNTDDKDWFEKQIHLCVAEDLGEEYESILPQEPLFVNFMKDPDDMIDGAGEDEDVPDYPNVYEPVISFDTVRDRLNHFMEQYNEVVRGSKMDLVFFRDAVLHILRIARIIRTDRGSAMLVGVGGSGKQSLTQLSSFVGGYSTFQITLTRAYNASNLLDDFKVLYRIAGQRGQGVAFIFTDNEIKEEGFLEYMNNVLSSGELANLFPRDEIDEINNELIMPMKKEFPKRVPTPDSLYDYFITRSRKNLHIVLCFSPVGEKFRTRAMKFPGIISGCTMDWFSSWPTEALVAVAKHSIAPFPVVCPGEVKAQLIEMMGTVHDDVSRVCLEYFDRFRRRTHVTPKSYLSFLACYKVLYKDKRKHYEVLSRRMDGGLIKLQEAGAQVSVLSKDLEVMEQNLAVASAEAETVLADVTIVQESAQKVKDEVKIVKDGAEELVKIITTEKGKAESQLAEAKPALQEAEDALKVIQPSDIATVKKLGKPPHLIMRIMDCILLFHYKHLDPYTVDPEKRCPKPSWAEAGKLLSNLSFLQMLQRFPLDTINGEMLELMDPIMSMEDYTKDNAIKVCGNVAGLLSWTKALCIYYGVNKDVLPLKMNLAMSEGKLLKANRRLSNAQHTLLEKEENLLEVKKVYDAAMSKRQVLLDDANRCKRKMNLASDLINGLAGEKERWTEQSKSFKSQIIRLIGDILLLSGFLSYTGPFNQEYRGIMLDAWRADIKKRRIPSSININVVSMLVEPHIIGEWNLHGLPNDDLSVQNGIIATMATRYPLMVDPQIQGKAWVKSLEKQNDIKVSTQVHKYFRNTLEVCLSQGKPFMIEDIGEDLDPVLTNVLEKNFIRSGSIQKVKLGDAEVEVANGFRLFITTKLPNPSYSPEISARASIIDFTVTMKGLEDQLLGRVIKTEKEELEAERIALVEGVTSNKRKMQELEENLLSKLSSIQGSLLDDESLVDVLNTTRTTALDVKEKLYVAAETEKKINAAREEFRSIATRGSILYFLICDMGMVNCMYQTSLNQFLGEFDHSMYNSEKSPQIFKRIANIIDYLTFEINRYITRGLYETDKFLFTLLMTFKIDLHRGTLKHQEFQTLVKGGAALDLNALPPKPTYAWITDLTWLNLNELVNLPQFTNIITQVQKNEKAWHSWYEKDAPEEEHIPDGYDKLDAFKKLLIIRSFCLDRVILQSRKYVAESLGKKFVQPVILNFEQLFQESQPKMPLCCFLSMGSAPSPQIEALAKKLKIRLRDISMGQGQEVHARKLLAHSMKDGGWVLLQNCHLALDFLSELKDSILEPSKPHAGFRLWVTTEVHCKFSISLLQSCIKFTNDPPQGIRAGMKRTYSSMNQDMIDFSNATQYKPMLYSISFFHSVVQERRKFGPLGWNIPYEFGWADWAACVGFFQTYLDETDVKKGISWVTIRYLVGEVHYGGRVTDDYDKRLLLTFCKLWFNDAILQEGFVFSEGYVNPKFKLIEEYLKFIDEMPLTETPFVYGLHANAGITQQGNQSKDLLDKVMNMQPKDSSSGGGESRETIVYRLASELLEKVPPAYVPYRIKERLAEMGGATPMNTVLRQELDRMQKVLKVVKATLVDLKLAIEGTIIMNEALRDALDNMYDAKVPNNWRKVSWQSTTLGFWFTELLERNNQLSKWINSKRPNAFWMTGFFNPQGFLTAMRQEVTRSHKGWSLDSVAIQNEVLKMSREEIGGQSPQEGVYIYGLFLEGAGWDKNQSKIIESAPKVLFVAMPVVHIFATDKMGPKDPALYECPIYKKPPRTLLNFVSPVWLKSGKNPDHWTIRGAALLCDVK